MKPAGLLLAGGAGSRMGAPVAKPLLPIAGRSIAAHVLDRLTPFCEPVLVSANEAKAFAALGHLVLGDRRRERLGPLAGLEAAYVFLSARAEAPEEIVTLPGDTPFLPADIAPRLTAGDRNRIRVASFGGRLHPTVGAWPLRALASLSGHLDRPDGERSVRAFLQRTGYDPVPFDPDPAAPGGDPFFNVNTPADLARARAHASE